MTALKSVVLATALLASGSSIVLAQSPDNVVRTPNGAPAYIGGPAYMGGPPYTGPEYTGAPAYMGGPPYTGPEYAGAPAPSTAPVTRHHGRMYMSAKPNHHRALNTGQTLPKQPQ